LTAIPSHDTLPETKEKAMPKIRKIKQFDRTECSRLGGAIETALQKVGQQYGVHIQRGNGRFSPTNLTLKLEVSVLDESGEAVSREEEAFKKHATVFGLKASDLHKTFKDWKGRQYEIIGLNTRARKNPILAKDLRSGKTFVWPEEEVKTLLERA
jgi:hypothetical protein